MTECDIEAQPLKNERQIAASYTTVPPPTSPTYGTVVDTELSARVAAGHVCRRRPHLDYRGRNDCCSGFLAGLGMGVIFGLAAAGLVFLFIVYSFTHE